MPAITKKLIRYNFSSRDLEQIKYIVIHDTGNTGPGADADAHFRFFNGGDRGASAHYFVDDHSIIQTVEDYKASWHCGDGQGLYGITNRNSIGVEICINEDGDYEKSVSHTRDLTMNLMQRHLIPPSRVVRHYDASKKICPGTMSADNWARWHAFKANLETEEARLITGVMLFERIGLIDSPDYWLANARKGEFINGEYAAILIGRMADYIYLTASSANKEVKFPGTNLVI